MSDMSCKSVVFGGPYHYYTTFPITLLCTPSSVSLDLESAPRPCILFHRQADIGVSIGSSVIESLHVFIGIAEHVRNRF